MVNDGTEISMEREIHNGSVCGVCFGAKGIGRKSIEWVMHPFRKVPEICSLFLMLGLWVSCSGDEPPVAPLPEVDEAVEIERNSAKLSGSVASVGQATVQACFFRYGLSEGMESSVEAVQGESGKWEARIDGLQAGSTYYYCLEITSGKSSLRSRIRQFRTLPNLVPTIGKVELVSKGPLSATVKCALMDGGGEAFGRIGFLYRKADADVETFVSATLVEADGFMAQLRGLEMGTDYSVRACAGNSLGERQSEAFTFQTNSAIQVAEAGTLAEIVGAEWKYRLRSMTVAGDLNGTDICFLREMLGKKADGTDTEGILEELNLSDCRIVAGGKPYVPSKYTSDDTLGSEMFGGCTRLRQLTLPQSLLTVEEEALRGCTALESVQIPEKVTAMGYSSGCTKLAAYALSPLNTAFAVVDGVLYSADRTQLLLYPMGRVGESFALPETVERIGKNAFRESLLQSIVIPDKVKALGEYTFASSALQVAEIGNGVTNLPIGAFQQCRRLVSVTLGEEVRRVGDYAFDGCDTLSEMKVKATYPPTCGTAVFEPETYARCTLSVPSGCKAIYRSSSSWNGFGRMVEVGD